MLQSKKALTRYIYGQAPLLWYSDTPFVKKYKMSK